MNVDKKKQYTLTIIVVSGDKYQWVVSGENVLHFVKLWAPEMLDQPIEDGTVQPKNPAHIMCDNTIIQADTIVTMNWEENNG